MTKSMLGFPVRGVAGGWRDAWSGPDPAATVQAQFATWAASAAGSGHADDVATPPPSPSSGERASDSDRHILVGVSQPRDDPSQHRAFTLRARFDRRAGGWVAQLGEQNHNDQIEGWTAVMNAETDAQLRIFPTAAACLGAAVTRLIELVDQDVAAVGSSS
jgi:hypothetical protein